MFSMAWAEMEYVGSDKKEMAELCMENLVVARKNLGLFQHHDGITGTAKDHVVLDYGDKMVTAIRNLQEVISQSSNFLLTKSRAQDRPDLSTTYFDLDEARSQAWSLPEQTTVQIQGPEVSSRLVIFNSHGRRRQELVTFKVSKPDVLVYVMATIEDEEEEEETVPTQISPVF